MTADIITIGDEILIGQTVDNNSAWIATKLNEIGIKVRHITSISDNPNDIKITLREVLKKSDIIIITGGLGPTNDDLTKNALADFFNSPLHLDKNVLKHIEKLFASFGKKLSDNNKNQALVPDKCKVLFNKYGTAPGMLFEENNKVIVSLPGVPHEMKQIMQDSVITILKNKFKLDKNIIHKIIHLQGIEEASLSNKLKEWELNLPEFIKLAYLPQPDKGLIKLRLSAYVKKEEREKLNTELDKQIKSLRNIADKYIYGFDDDSLEKIIGDLLKKKRKTLATAESCTGGYIAHLITSVPSSSNYYKGSIVSYANEIKHNILNVSTKNLKKYGAVSKEVVEEMAKGILKIMNVDYVIASSGIAGPEGGSKEKAVGTIWISVADKNSINSKMFHFGKERIFNIKRSAYAALNMLRKKILQDEPVTD